MKRNATKSWADLTDAKQKEAERAARVRQHERTDLLGIAGCYTAREDRGDPAKVMAVAAPLLAWLDEAASDLDRSARMAALREVKSGWDGRFQSVSASELVVRASVFYRFIAA